MHHGERVRLKSLTSQRFETFWAQFGSSINSRRLAIIGSEAPQNFTCLRDKELCHFISNTKDSLIKARDMGFLVSTSLKDCYDIVIMELTKSKEANFGLIYLADEYIRRGGAMIINGDNKLGIKSFLKNISNYWADETTLVKNKGRIALYHKKKKIFNIGKNI